MAILDSSDDNTDLLLWKYVTDYCNLKKMEWHKNMDKKIYRKYAYAMIRLTGCAIDNKIPDKKRIEMYELSLLFQVCQEHNLTAAVAYALESAGIVDDDFKQAKEKAIRKNILFDAERNKIMNIMEQKGIWHMALKGAVLKDYYPKLGMRQMADNDILIDGNYRSEVKDIMLGEGFISHTYADGMVDEYYKEPVYNFELHSELFTEDFIPELHDYYINIKERLVKDNNKEFGYHFTQEDFYIYFTAHEYKHYKKGGTGVRSLLDTYIFMRKFSDELDWKYLYGELEKLGIKEYEQEQRLLAFRLFQKEKLSVEDRRELDYYIYSGTYGTLENSMNNALENKADNSVLRYLFRKAFPPLVNYKVYFPWAYRHKVLIPIAWLYRLVRGVFTRREKFVNEIKSLLKKR